MNETIPLSSVFSGIRIVFPKLTFMKKINATLKKNFLGGAKNSFIFQLLSAPIA